MWPLLGGLVSGGLNLIGGMFGQSNQSSINAQNAAMQAYINNQNVSNAQTINEENVAMQEGINANNINAQTNINAANLANSRALNASNIAMQEEFAKNGVQWRVADAKAAGISPLAALGASTQSFQNQVGTELSAGAPQQAVTQVAPTLGVARADASNAFGSGVSAFGQDLSRAISATRSPEEMAVAIEKTRQDLESGQLDNELKKAQLASTVTRLHSAQLGPGIPKVHAEMQSVRMPDGSIQPFPSRDVEGAAWIDEMAKFQWMMRNQVEPSFGYNIPKELGAPGEGKAWYRNPMTGNYDQWPTMWSIMKSLYGRASSMKWPDLSPSP